MPPRRNRRPREGVQEEPVGRAPPSIIPYLPMALASSSPMLQTAPSQQFRSAVADTNSVQESRSVIAEMLLELGVALRQCRTCGIMLLGSRNYEPFAERDGWCCGGTGQKSRRHVLWPTLTDHAWEIDGYDFPKYARMLNSLVSVAVVHGPRGEGNGWMDGGDVVAAAAAKLPSCGRIK